jgi:hypothetical protein
MTQQSAQQAERTWRDMQSTMTEFGQTIQGSCAAATRESIEYGKTVLRTTMSQAQSAVELTKTLGRAKTPSEMVEILSTHARQQMEAAAAQNQELWSAAQKIFTSATIPLKSAHK